MRTLTISLSLALILVMHTATVQGQAPPRIDLMPTAFNFLTPPMGGQGPADQTLTIRNGGSGTFRWTATVNAAWLSVSPTSADASAASPSLVTVRVNSAGLLTGMYSATITITAPGVSNSPQIVPVRLTVTPQITSVVPSIGFSTTRFDLLINGENFRPGAQVQLCSGVRISAPPTVLTSGRQMVVSVEVQSGRGNCQVTVTNPDQQSATLPDIFRTLNLSPGMRIAPSPQLPTVSVSAAGGFNTGRRSPVAVASDPAALLTIAFNTNELGVVDLVADPQAIVYCPLLPMGFDPQEVVMYQDSALVGGVVIYQDFALVTDGYMNGISLVRLRVGGRSGTCAYVTSIPTGRTPAGMAVNQRTKQAVVALRGEGAVSVLDLSRIGQGQISEIRRVVLSGSGVTPDRVAIDSVENKAYISNSAGSEVRVVNLNTFAEERSISVGANPSGLYVVEDTRLLVVANRGSNTVSVARLQTGELLGTLPVGQGPTRVAVYRSRNVGLVLNSADPQYTLSVIDLTALQERRVAAGINPTGITIVPALNSAIILNAAPISAAQSSGKQAAAQPLAGGSLANRYGMVNFPSVMNFPRMLAQSDERTSVAFVNSTNADAVLELAMVDGEGFLNLNVANPRQVVLPTGQQLARFVDELLPNFAGSGWLRGASLAVGVKGFFLSQSTDFKAQDGADEKGEVLQEAVLLDVSQQGEQYTEITVINPNAQPASVNLELVDNDSGNTVNRKTISLSAFGGFRDRTTTVFPESTDQAGGYIRIRATVPVRAYEQLRAGARWLVALNARSGFIGQPTLFLPQFAFGSGWGTSIHVINLEAVPQTVTIAAFSEAGGPLGQPVLRTLAANGKAVVDILDLGIPAGEGFVTGWVRIQGQGRLTGHASYGTDQVRAAVPVQEAPRTDLTFSHVAEGNIGGLNLLTGLALLNPNATAAEVRIEVKRMEDGTTLGRRDLTLAGNGRISRRLSELVAELDAVVRAAGGFAGGYVQVRSSLPLYGLELFLTDNELSAIPAQ